MTPDVEPDTPAVKLPWPDGTVIERDTWHFHSQLLKRYGIILAPGEFSGLQRAILSGKAILVQQKATGSAIYSVRIASGMKRIFVHAKAGHIFTAWPSRRPLRQLLQQLIAERVAGHSAGAAGTGAAAAACPTDAVIESEALQPGPGEVEIVGTWVIEAGGVVADQSCRRIRSLTDNHLEKIGDAPLGGGWVSLYRHPGDGRFWERDFPASDMHGGGPPRLRWLTTDQVIARYGEATVLSLDTRRQP